MKEIARRTDDAYYPLECLNQYTDKSLFTVKLLYLKYKKVHNIKYENSKDIRLSCETSISYMPTSFTMFKAIKFFC
jgi:hypothetical protein